MVPKHLKAGWQQQAPAAFISLPVPTGVEVTQRCDGHRSWPGADHHVQENMLIRNNRARTAKESRNSCYKDNWKDTIFIALSLAVSKFLSHFKEWHRGDTFLLFSVQGNCAAENGPSWKTQSVLQGSQKSFTKQCRNGPRNDFWWRLRQKA